jgi:hypothetical protein
VSEAQDGVGRKRCAAITLTLILPWVKYRSAIIIEDAQNVGCQIILLKNLLIDYIDLLKYVTCNI